MTTADMKDASRRRFINAAGVASAAALFTPPRAIAEDYDCARSQQASPTPTSPLTLQKIDTAIVFIDPQNDVFVVRR
jgi:hypothetical protein